LVRAAGDAGNRRFPEKISHFGRSGSWSGSAPRDAHGWEFDDLVEKLVTAVSRRDESIQERKVRHVVRCAEPCGNRVADCLAIGVPA
jgi:hypothetical protein